MEGKLYSLILYSIEHNIYKQNYFDNLQSVGLYTDSEADKIALLFIYFPIIRQEVYNFVHLWNNHRIRYQKNRSSLPTGKPSVLYFTPPNGIHDYGSVPSLEIINQIQNEVLEWGMNHY